MSNNPLSDLLGSLFGQDSREEDFRRFDDRYTRGQYQDLDDREVQQRYRQTLRNAPPEIIEDAHAEAFSRLDPQERRLLAQRLRQQAAMLDAPYTDPYDRDEFDEDPRTLAHMARRAEEQNPSILDQLFNNQPGPLNNPMVKMALAGAAAMAARRFLGGQGTQGQMNNQNQRGGSPLSDLFGGQSTGSGQNRNRGGGGGFRGGGTPV
jgi:hypothetical protein